MQNWVVPYSNGKLTAIGYSNHKQVNTSSLTTASSAYKICATVDKIELKANGQDLSYITLSIKDKQGNLHPKAKNLIKFKLIGEGEIVGVGNGNPTSLESYQKLQRTAWQGKCIVIVKSTQKTGKIVLEATSNGLVSARTTLFSK
jgi:beta-galactosidase